MKAYTRALLVVLVGVVLSETEGEQESPADAHDSAKARYSRSPPDKQGTGKCSYTFIVPQQKLSGAICVSSKNTEGSGVNKTEIHDLKEELRKQQLQIEQLKQIVEVDGTVVNEVRFLRKESRNMNSRVTQLYTQLLHEIIQKKDYSLEASQLENRVLNTTAEVLKIATKYQDLQQKYGLLASMINNQSVIIAQLEKQCQLKASGQHTQQNLVQPPPLVNVVPNSLVPGNSSKSRNHFVSINEIQRDQTAAAVDPTQDRKQVVRKPLPSTSPPPSTETISPLPEVTSTEETDKSTGPWKDCAEALRSGQGKSGIFILKPLNINQMMQVWCDQQYDQGGWTVIQRRQDGSVNFFATWQNYKQGFGNMDGEYWLGLENLHWLTNQDSYKLLILMEDWQGRQVFAEYDHFSVEPESDFYRLRLGNYRGNAGDSLSWHNDKQFSTLDKDRDAYTGNCAHYQKGGWWYNMCAHSNLNGVWYKGGHYRSRYQDGVYWAEFRGGAYSLKKVAMMIKPSK
ncbi:angiopoietin-related protein 6 [Ambystoma mexicanum]|uniref:angiopoietin-related protein 6 n=1 Tax=Ambystoma mexicanum TaxID=8296 RepID=UPI0037E9673C